MVKLLSIIADFGEDLGVTASAIPAFTIKEIPLSIPPQVNLSPL